MYHCCSPCVCDANDYVRVDTKTITTADGAQSYNVLVMGNPCEHPEKLTETFTDPFSHEQSSLSQSAPELTCSGNVLEGATVSDGGHPIIGLFFASDGSEANTYDAGTCATRAESGYASGMGQLFRQVAQISPL